MSQNCRAASLACMRTTNVSTTPQMPTVPTLSTPTVLLQCNCSAASQHCCDTRLVRPARPTTSAGSTGSAAALTNANESQLQPASRGSVAVHTAATALGDGRTGVGVRIKRVRIKGVLGTPDNLAPLPDRAARTVPACSPSESHQPQGIGKGLSEMLSL